MASCFVNGNMYYVYISILLIWASGIFSVRYEFRLTTGCKQVKNRTRVPGSFLSEKDFGTEINSKILFKNNTRIVSYILYNSVTLKINLKSTETQKLPVILSNHQCTFI